MRTNLIINVGIELGGDYPSALREAHRLACMLDLVVALDVQGRRAQVRPTTDVEALIVQLFGEGL